MARFVGGEMVEIDPAWKIEIPKNQNIAAMLKFPPAYYKDRIKKLGFTGQDAILLDAGCGAGHWSAAASRLNKEVYGIDATEKYLNVAKEIIKSLKIENCQLKIGKLESLPYKDNYFDYIICYSVWMFTDKEKALKEFHRVLKPSGKIYLGSIIGPSWYPNLILKGVKEGKLELILDSLRAIKRGIPLRAKTAKDILKKHNFEIIDLNSDGRIGRKDIKIKPIYKGIRWGFWEIFEVLAEKNSKFKNQNAK